MRRVVAVALAILVVGSLGVGYFVGNGNRQIITTTTTTMTFATTIITTSLHMTPLSRNDGDWAFSIRLQNSLLAMGQEIALSYNLTNISGQPQTVHSVNPLVNPTIYSANGAVVWAWNPPQSNGITTIPSKAGNWPGPIDIPTSSLSAGQEYVLSVYPLIGATTTSAMVVGDYSIGESLMINTTIGATDESTTTISTLATEPPCPAGQSGPFGLRILFDSNQSQVTGAKVEATNQPAFVSCNGSPPYPLTSTTAVSFTTNSYTGWYYLDSAPDAGYSVEVTYQGQQYNLTASLHPEYAFCATLFVPSGRTNSTGTEFQTSCP